ncbi:MAG: TonB-dependent receptor [Alphaproteobacteria bacterium]|nr:TonB-dependent receptor [Alphaproteobacteria bacterium]
MRVLGKRQLPANRFVTAVVLTTAVAAGLDPIDAKAQAQARIDEIIVIGTLDRLKSIGGSGTIVSEEDLNRSRVFTTVEALRQVPGVLAREEEGLGIRPNIGIRGLNPIRSTKVLLLEDGIPLGYAPYGDNAAYYHPPIDRFARIEVLKGASQIKFGPQTVGGVINYITPAAPENPTGRATISGGSDGYREIDAFAGGPGLGGRVLLHANRTESNGSRENQDLGLTDLYGKAEWDRGEHVFSLRASRFAEDSKVTYSGLTRAEFAANPRSNQFSNDEFMTERYSMVGSHGWDINADLLLKTTGYYHYFDRDWWRQSSNSGQRPNDASDPACGGMANLDTTCGNEGRLRSYHTYGIESRLLWDHGDSGLEGSTEIGVRAHHETQTRLQLNADTPRGRTAGTGVNAGVRENNRRSTTAFSGFAQSDLTFGDFGIGPGVRAEFVDYERTFRPVSVIASGRPTGALTAEVRGETDLDQVVPGLSATYQLSDQARVYGGVHRGFAPPRVEDIIGGAGTSVDLDAELSWNYELGLRASLGEGLSANVGLFQMDFENQVVPASVAGGVGATLTSAGKTKHRGAEASANFSTALKDGGEVYARAAVTYVGKANYVGFRRSSACAAGQASVTLEGLQYNCFVTGNRLPYSPKWLTSAAVGAGSGWFSGQVEVQHQSGMFADDLNSTSVTADAQRGLIKGWTIVNLSLNITPDESSLSVYVTVKNVFDKLYIVDRARGALPGAPQLIQAGATVSF